MLKIVYKKIGQDNSADSDQLEFSDTKVLYVQEVVTLQKKYLLYLHQKMRFTPFINYYDI